MPDDKQKIIILDQNLKDLLGHYFEYDRSVATAAAKNGLETVVLSHRSADLPSHFDFQIEPTYSSDMWRTIEGESFHSNKSIKSASDEFFNETVDAIARLSVKANDILFLPTITKAQLPAAARLVEKYGPKGMRVFILLRYQRSLTDGEASAAAFQSLEASAEKWHVTLCTDSNRLAIDLGTLTKLPIAVFPIPHTDSFSEPTATPLLHDKYIHFVTLGNARGEKGLAEIFEAVALTSNEPWADKVRFTLQCNNPSDDVVDAIAAYRECPDSRVTLVDRIMSTDEYYATLESANVVLTPYHRDIYRERTSGVFLEGITSGKIVIGTDDTWMSDLLSEFGGGVVCLDRDSRSMADKIGEVVESYSELSREALRAASELKHIHTADNLVAHMTGCAPIPVLNGRERKAVLIYPWGDAVEGRSGAGMRMRLMIRYLEQYYGDIRVLFTAQGERGGNITPRTTAEPYFYCESAENRQIQERLEAINHRAGGNPNQSFHLWFHQWPLQDKAFAQRCEDLISWADDVFLDYSFFAPVVDKICRRLHKPLTTTQFDVVSDQAKGVPVIHQLTQQHEMDALRGLSEVVSCTKEDHDFLERMGVPSKLIPHPIDLDAQLPLSDEEVRFLLEDVYGLPIAGKKVCFFVGSSYELNRKASEFVRKIADEFAEDDDASDIYVIVAGGCAQKERTENFASLNFVEDIILSALYKRADLVLVPLSAGTGSSIKSIEALAYGTAVLSTSVGMRGIPVAPGYHCLIENDLLSFKTRILDELKDGANLERLRQNARKFGAAYDYRKLFRAYRVSGRPLAKQHPPIDLSAQLQAAWTEVLPVASQCESPEIVEMACEKAGFSTRELEELLTLEGRQSEAAETHEAPQKIIEADTDIADSAGHDDHRDERSNGARHDSELTPTIPPSGGSWIKRIAKAALLTIPPVRTLYSSLLLSNQRVEMLSHEAVRLRRDKERLAHQVDMLSGAIKKLSADLGTKISASHCALESSLAKEIVDSSQLQIQILSDLSTQAEKNARASNERQEEALKKARSDILSRFDWVTSKTLGSDDFRQSMDKLRSSLATNSQETISLLKKHVTSVITRQNARFDKHEARQEKKMLAHREEQLEQISKLSLEGEQVRAIIQNSIAEFADILTLLETRTLKVQAAFEALSTNVEGQGQTLMEQSSADRAAIIETINDSAATSREHSDRIATVAEATGDIQARIEQLSERTAALSEDVVNRLNRQIQQTASHADQAAAGVKQVEDALLQNSDKLMEAYQQLQADMQAHGDKIDAQLAVRNQTIIEASADDQAKMYEKLNELVSQAARSGEDLTALASQALANIELAASNADTAEELRGAIDSAMKELTSKIEKRTEALEDHMAAYDHSVRAMGVDIGHRQERQVALQEDLSNALREMQEYRLSAIDERQRELASIILKEQLQSLPSFRLETKFPVAIDSADHTEPRGTTSDNTHHLPFVRRCAELFGPEVLALDLGCAGGGLVYDFLLEGHRALGLEGSDVPLRKGRGEWKTIKPFLKTCDITHPFNIYNEDGEPELFDIITAWEVLEHIPEDRIPTLFNNVKRHLRPKGLFVASVALYEDVNPDSGTVYHVTLKPREWWVKKLTHAGLVVPLSPFGIADMVRGSGNGQHDWDAKRNPDLGFHIVAGLPDATNGAKISEVKGKSSGSDGKTRTRPSKSSA